jgi:HK97 gp10 family phage protein
MAFTNRVRLQRRLKAIPLAVRRALKAQNAVNAAELVETVKGFMPVDDGTLRSSVKHQDVSDSTRISQRVSAGGAATTKPVRSSSKGNAPLYDYALAQEYGTEKMPANPAFWPAWRLKRRRFKARMSRAAKKAIQGA